MAGINRSFKILPTCVKFCSIREYSSKISAINKSNKPDERSRSNATKKLRNKEKKEASVDGFAPHFEEKLRSWSSLLNIELKAKKEHADTDSRVYAIEKCPLRFHKQYYAVGGRYLQLKFRHQFGGDDFTKISSVCRPGTMFQVFVNNPTDHASGDANTNQANAVHEETTLGKEEETGGLNVVLTNINPTYITFKVMKDCVDFNETQRKFGTFKLVVSDENCPLMNLSDLLADRDSWQKYPGYDCLLHVYRIKSLPISAGVRPPKLPEQFNEEQRNAVLAALSDQPITAIHGPPGTGKTKVIAEIIHQLVSHKGSKKILVCAPSHKAVSNIQRACHEKGLTKYCKMHGEETNYSNNINNLVKNHEMATDLEKIHQSLNEGRKQLTEMEEIELRLDSKLLQRKIRQSIAKDVSVIFSTISSMSVRGLIQLGFKPDLCIIDEAGQAMECETWPIIFQAPRVIVVGDYNQLPAIVTSKEAKANGLEVSLIEWLAKEFGPSVNFPLQVQYRFNTAIQRWPNEQFYKGSLTAHESVENCRLLDLFPESKGEDDRVSTIIDDPLVLVDTDLYNTNSKAVPQKMATFFQHSNLFLEKSLTPSILNVGEAIICAHHYKALLSRLSPQQIGCITPYNAQVQEIKRFLLGVAADLDISSVDAFQGQEREAIIFSLVRKNPGMELGFLTEYRRLNVAVSRAKRQFFLVASSSMLKSNSVLNNFYEVIRMEGRILSPEQFFDSSKIEDDTSENAFLEKKIAIRNV
ncbi:AAA domain-containing protein [Ditylenchus destructor]|nr:AAA domain-containing protein [Ditylenchus destructor]